MTCRPELIWLSDTRVLRPGTPPVHVAETWVSTRVDALWTIGYRIDAIAGAPRIAEARLWPTKSSRDGAPPTVINEAPASAPPFERAQRVLSPRGALACWWDDSGDPRAPEWVRETARAFGYDPAAPFTARADDPYYLAIAERHADLKRRNGKARHADLALELKLSPDAVRKLIYRCRRDRGLLVGDDLTAYARELRRRLDECAA